MRKLLLVIFSTIVFASIVYATSVGTGIIPNIGTEDFEPMVWMCNNRVLTDDNTEPGRLVCDPDLLGDLNEDCIVDFDDFLLLIAEFLRTDCTLANDWCNGADLDNDGNVDLVDFAILADHFDDQGPDSMAERMNNYLFEGEQIQWDVLVMDKNGMEKIEDVFATLGQSQGLGNDIEVNCLRIYDGDISPPNLPDCNAWIFEEQVSWNNQLMAMYRCIFTAETAESMYGEYWLTVEVTDLDGLSGIMDENEYWFLNPIVALAIEGDLEFDNVRPGTRSYSETLLVGNDADPGSGVMLDMFISGTDFYDSSSSGAMCPDTNQLSLSAFRYYATNGAYSTIDDLEIDYVNANRDRDAEGYVNIEYGIGFNDPSPFYNNAEIIQAQMIGPYYLSNTLSPGAEMSITFRLELPEPCNGDFDTGTIYFWGEAI